MGRQYTGGYPTGGYPTGGILQGGTLLEGILLYKSASRGPTLDMILVGCQPTKTVCHT